jgi:hypothetical protein
VSKKKSAKLSPEATAIAFQAITRALEIVDGRVAKVESRIAVDNADQRLKALEARMTALENDHRLTATWAGWLRGKNA